MSLMFGPLTGHVALWLGDGDHTGLAPQHSVIFVPLGVRRVFCTVVPAPLALRATSLSRHHDRTVVHLPALLHATPTLHEAVLKINKRDMLDF